MHELNPRKELGNENTRLFFKQFKEKSILENIEIFHTLMTLRKLPFGLNYFDITIFCLMNIRNANHKGKYSKYKLSNDIEKNPGPAIYYVDPSKTIRAPYSQGMFIYLESMLVSNVWL